MVDEAPAPLEGGGLLLFSLKIVYTLARSSSRSWFWQVQQQVIVCLSPLAVESLPAALPGCPDWLVEEEKAFSTSPCSKVFEIPIEKAKANAAGGCQWCTGFQPLGSFWMHIEGNTSKRLLYSVMALLINECKGSAAFLKHQQHAKLQHYATEGD